MTLTPARDAGPSEGLLPRFQEGGSPQHLLVTLLGDYWLTREEHLPSGALVRLMGEFGVSEVGARSALSRLQRRGLLEHSKRGRHTHYGLTRAAAREILIGARRIIAFGSDGAWDGSWTVFAFSLPESRRDTRHAMRSQLRWLGFGLLYDGVWVSPRASAEAAMQLAKELDVRTATAFVGKGVAGDSHSRAPVAAWNLDELRAIYDEFLADCERLLAAIHSGAMAPAEALVARTSLMDTYRRFPSLDPELPLELMPRSWPRPLARDRFHEAFDLLAPLAEVRVRQIIAQFDSTISAYAQCYTTATLIGDGKRVSDK